MGILLPVLLICICCWSCGYYFSIGYPIYPEASASPLWNALCKVLPSKELCYLIGLLLMCGGAFLLHNANYALALVRERTLLPMLLYLLFISTNNDLLPFTSTSLGSFCLVLAIYQLMSAYHDPKATRNMFNAAALIAIGSLLWIHILWFIPVLWIGMYNFRCLSIQTFLSSLIGIITVYWILLGISVWFDTPELIDIPFGELGNIHFLDVKEVNMSSWIGIATLVTLTVLSALNIVAHGNEDLLRTRQYLSFLTLLAIFSFALYFLYEQNSEEFLQTTIIPAALLIGHFFAVRRGRWICYLFYFVLALYCSLFILRTWNF